MLCSKTSEQKDHLSVQKSTNWSPGQLNKPGGHTPFGGRKIFNYRYVEKNYIKSNGLFPPKTWAGLVEKEDIRYTNNGAESFHKHFNSMFSSNQRPHILKFLEVMAEIDSLRILKLQSCKTLQKNAFSDFKQEHQDLEEGKMTIELFLKIVTKKHVLPLSYM